MMNCSVVFDEVMKVPVKAKKKGKNKKIITHPDDEFHPVRYLSNPSKDSSIRMNKQSMIIWKIVFTLDLGSYP